ncbi:MAG: STAS domain-containing protein [Butyrivibrio sp.]|nr:STAS domain-containing protein [Butyrivibrio sp.]
MDNGIIFKRIDEGERLRVIVDGPLDTINAPVLEDELLQDAVVRKELVLDLEKVPYISSAGIRAILLLLKTIEGHGKMRLINVSEEILEVLDTIGFLDILSIEEKA